MIEVVADSTFAMRSIAEKLASVVRRGDLILLVGDLGAGKTTFTQGFGRGLGIDELITSPTFVLLRTYEAKLPLHHIDVYRLEHLQEVIDLGLMELLDEGGVAVIEWGDLAAPVLPRDYLEVRLGFDERSDDVRKLTFVTVGPSWAGREASIKDVIT